MKTKILFYLCIVGFFACSGGKKKEETIKFSDIPIEQIDTNKFDELDAKFGENDTSMKAIPKGATWRMWRKIHKQCMADQWFPDAYYLGVSNTMNLGTIADQEDFLKRSMDSTSGFTKEELAKLIKLGDFTSCNISQELTVSINVFFKAEFDFSNTGDPNLSAELGAAISNSKSTKVKIDQWRVNNLQEDLLKDMLKKPKPGANDPGTKDGYRESLLTPNNKILSKVIEVKGFSSTITTETEISAGLEAKLKEGLIANMGNGEATVKFKFVNKKTIEVTSSGTFYVFGKFRLATAIMGNPPTNS